MKITLNQKINNLNAKNTYLPNQNAEIYNCDLPRTPTTSLWSTNVKNKISLPLSSYGISFKANDEDIETTKDFKIRQLNGIICPDCGKEMLSVPASLNLRETIKKAPESEHFKILSEYEQFMMQKERNIFCEMKKVARTSPNADLKELLTILHRGKIGLLEQEQLEVLENIRHYVLTSELLTKKERKKLKNTIKDCENSILDKTGEPFRRKAFLNTITGPKIHNNQAKAIIKKIAETCPSSQDNENAWIVKNSKKDKDDNERSSLEIAEKLLMTSWSSADHMLAKNLSEDDEKNGEDLLSNYMGMHALCNSNKYNKTFLEWVNEEPQQRLNNLILYFVSVQKAINNGEISDPRYETYVEKALTTIATITNGQVYIPIEQIKKLAAE